MAIYPQSRPASRTPTSPKSTPRLDTSVLLSARMVIRAPARNQRIPVGAIWFPFEPHLSGVRAASDPRDLETTEPFRRTIGTSGALPVGPKPPEFVRNSPWLCARLMASELAGSTSGDRIPEKHLRETLRSQSPRRSPIDRGPLESAATIQVVCDGMEDWTED